MLTLLPYSGGDGVIDVAGGRGDLAFELHTKRAIRTTLVKPLSECWRVHMR